MEEIMSSDNFVNELQKGNNLGAEDAFKSAMQDKVADALETKRKEVANNFVQNKKVESDAEEV
tara:strand:- start:145 stop:333 length:189 start_codon:yes stop_codon:yes gene_type:complete